MFNFVFLTCEYNVVELENRLLSRFDTASQRNELSTMSECAKILSQVNHFILQHAPFQLKWEDLLFYLRFEGLP